MVTCIPERSKVCLEGSSQPFFHILRIETAASKDERPQLCVSVVVDASGSMAGQKLLNAKRGVRKLIKHLGPHDVLNCVAYDSDASTVFNNGDLSPEGKPELVNLVRQLKTGGATNLHAGLERGVELLRDSPTGSVRRVFLFSDGCVNAGVTDHGEILAAVDRYHELDSVTVSTFGIGRDFDESLMVNIARRGKGTFEFLDRPEDITAQVSKSVHGLLNIAGLAATLTVGGLSGCSVLSVGAETGEEDRQAEDNTLNLGDLHSANTRQVLVKLELPGQSRGCDWLNTMEYRLTFIPPNGSEPVVIAGVVSVLYAPASAAVEPMHPHVVSAIAVRDAAASDAKAAKLLDNGQHDEALVAKRHALEVMEQALASTAADEGVASMLQRLLTKGRESLRKMEENCDSRTASLELACEAMRMRRHSYSDLMCERADSDCGNWSDEEDDRSLVTRDRSPPRGSGLQRQTSYGSDLGSDEDNDEALPQPRSGSRPVSPTLASSPTPTAGTSTKQTHCQQCTKPFSFLRWRHTCRRCSGVVCNSCSDRHAMSGGAVSRVCHSCHEDMSTPISALCPITHAPMADPVMASDGHSYERTAIERWFRTNRTSPMTGEVLASLTLIPNHTLRCMISSSDPTTRTWNVDLPIRSWG